MRLFVDDLKKQENYPLNLSDVCNKLIVGDVVESLKYIPDESVSLIFTSPPYNTEIKYDSHNDKMPWADYLSFLKQVWIECHRILKPGGRLCINIDAITNWDDDKDKEYIRPIYAELVNMMRDIEGMHFRSEIAWAKTGVKVEKEEDLDNIEAKADRGQVVGRATAWGSYRSCSNPVVMRTHEYILVWSKDSWRLDGDAELCDLSDVEFLKLTRSVWCVQPETSAYDGHPAPFPVELATNVIKLFSYMGDVVLDPFGGSGTTAVSSVKHWRRFIYVDCDKGYSASAKKRLEKAISSTYGYSESDGDISKYPSVEEWAKEVGVKLHSQLEKTESMSAKKKRIKKEIQEERKRKEESMQVFDEC